MSDTEKQQAEQRAKIYLTVLAGLLVIAVMVTMFTLYRDDQQLAENEESGTATEEQPVEAEQEALQSDQTQNELQEARPVENNFADANSQIQSESGLTAEAEINTQQLEVGKEGEAQLESLEDIEESDMQEEVAAEPQNMTAYFDPAEDLMVWPVSGVVLMDYSADALIYDETLDLYRTNDSISIGAAETEDVLAAADGIVTDIGQSDTLGNYVVLDNGNGYETTYGQLSDEALVALGEYVAQGEAIGRIDAPSWYSSALGTHLDFTVTVNGETVNPLEFLENVLEDE